MAHESEDFDALRKLLALKRHETPPPGYFDRLPREIHVRLAATRQPQALRESRRAESSNWLASLLRLVESRPSFVGAFGAAVCGLILVGIVYSHQRDEPAPTIMPELVRTPTLFQDAVNPADLPATTTLLASTNPVMPRPPAANLFDGTWLNAQPAAYPQPQR